jgi:epoxide hydrolase
LSAGTRPQTVAVGLSDSPIGLLAYSELFNSFGNGTSLVPLEAILTEVSVNWFANAAAGMSRSYFDNAAAPTEEPAPVNAAPTGVAVFADDFQTIKVFAERDNSKIVHWSRFEKGGHFAALEVPEIVVDNIRTFFTALR